MSNPILNFVGVLVFYFGLVAALTVVAAEFHERSHWVVARVWTRDVHIDRWRGVFAKTVVFHEPFDIPTYGVRLAGFAPALFGLIVGTMMFFLISTPFGISLLVALPFWASMLLSPSDLLAIVSPSRFQKFAEGNDSSGHIEMVKILLNEIR